MTTTPDDTRTILLKATEGLRPRRKVYVPAGSLREAGLEVDPVLSANQLVTYQVQELRDALQARIDAIHAEHNAGDQVVEPEATDDLEDTEEFYPPDDL